MGDNLVGGNEHEGNEGKWKDSVGFKRLLKYSVKWARKTVVSREQDTSGKMNEGSDIRGNDKF